MNAKALAFVVAVCLPSVAVADPFEAKFCLFASAAKLPTIPGLKVTRSVVIGEPRTDNRGLTIEMTTYQGEIDVEALGQQATYKFSCPLLGAPGTSKSIYPNTFLVTLVR